jgi:peptide/nickel transport system substrate-binding protein
MFSEWRKSSSIELTRFDGYWEEGLPKIDGLSFLFLPEYNAAKASFLSQQGDILLEFNATDLPTFEATEGVEVQSIYTLGFWWTGMNVQQEPFSDVRVRQAVKYALDRQQIVDLALGGRGAPATVPIPTDGPFYSPELDYARDVDLAKQLLTEAGYPDGLSVTLTVPKTSEEEPMGVVVQSQLKEVGIDAELEVLDVPNFLERVFTNRDYTIMIVGDTAGPDPAALLNRYYRSDSSSQVHNYANPEVDRLLGEAASVTDVAQRRDLYRQALLIALDEAPIVWMARAELRTAYWDYLSDFVSLPTLRYEWWRLSFNREK